MVSRQSLTFDDGSIRMVFSGGAELRAHHWRVGGTVQTSFGKARLGSFDHGNQYGLPAAIDAVQELQTMLGSAAVAQVRFDLEFGDLMFEFAHGAKLQVLNITGCEVWEIGFPNGTVEYSNYV